jgi:hypothetical protein
MLRTIQPVCQQLRHLPHVRRVEFGNVSLITYLINDGASAVIIVDLTWAG